MLHAVPTQFAIDEIPHLLRSLTGCHHPAVRWNRRERHRARGPSLEDSERADPCLAHGKTERPETSLQAGVVPRHDPRRREGRIDPGALGHGLLAPGMRPATTRPPVKNVSSIDDSGSDQP